MDAAVLALPRLERHALGGKPGDHAGRELVHLAAEAASTRDEVGEVDRLLHRQLP